MTNKQISIIVAIAENNAIGKNNELLWHISDDLKRFKKITGGNTIVMGKNTFYSLPIRPLPKRTNIVITDVADEKIEGCVMAYSIEDAIAKCDIDKENFIIGGGSVYNQFLPYANKLYITKVHKIFDADCFFPDVDYSKWKLIEKEPLLHDDKNDFAFSYFIYEKA
jgi:dihydrofolate reductase